MNVERRLAEEFLEVWEIGNQAGTPFKEPTVEVFLPRAKAILRTQAEEIERLEEAKLKLEVAELERLRELAMERGRELHDAQTELATLKSQEPVGVCERCGWKGTKRDCLPDEHMGFAVCPRCSRSHFRIPVIFAAPILDKAKEPTS